MENKTLALGSTLPSRITKPESLSETICPLMLKEVPAGFDEDEVHHQERQRPHGDACPGWRWLREGHLSR